ncbi:hypothetical protein B1B_01925 [mine drainage metagenome]|uniref:Conserved hypothetical protein CHP03032 domain-containing protein n=2 Tax=mine drainage metagenome TaxID=410659 RepID=T1D0Y8_9ZZZZ
MIRNALEASPNVIPFEARPDTGFRHWLTQSRSTLAVSTYQAGMLAFFSWNGETISVFLRRFEKIMGLDWDGTRLLLATRHALLVYSNSKVLAHRFREPGRYDALYLPRVSYPHPDLHIHDVALGPDRIWMVNTRFNCLAYPSDEHTFEPVWRPRFITDLVPEDRCHLNGLAMRNGQPAFVSALSETNTAGGWRDHKVAGGIVVDYASGEIVVRGLTMPHSPRVHEGSLYVLNSGAGELLRIDPDRGSTEVVCRLDGYLRGLTFSGSHALIGLCQARETQIFGGMPVEIAHDRLKCGLAVIDLRSGTRVGLLEITSGCTELFDIRVLTGQVRPAIVHADAPDALEAISVPGCYFWLRPENVIKD